MKSNRLISQYPHATDGVALVIVLAMLVLMSVLVLAFFSSVTDDFSASNAYFQGESAKRLADSAVNVVMAQIKDATAGFSRPNATNPLDTSKPLAWASQPGLIRTWDDSGHPANNYKLFSSDNMVVSGAYDPTIDQADIKSGNWNTETAIYTDLNSPVLIRDDTNGTIVSDPLRPTEKYIASAPIIDPNNLVDSSGLVPAGPSNTLAYDANGDGTPDIEGFYIAKSLTYNSSSAISPVNNPVPMPVKWLYVLQNGQLSAPGASGSNAMFNLPVQPVPSGQNPIVGRIAFWADDETSKINVNTASEGTFWDVPVAASQDEMAFAGNPPTQGEFQRVPGHPAMTCLSSVLGGGTLAVNHGTPQVADIPVLKKIYDFTPRIMAGDATHGSQGGTAPISQTNYAYAPQVGDLSPNPTGQGAQNLVIPKAIPIGTARLFPTVDDILFKQDRTLQDPSVISAATLKQSRFFLTANSRAPEVTLFNTPRISLWPITWPNISAFLANSYATKNRIPVSAGVTTHPLSDLLAVPMQVGTGKYLAPQEQLLAFCAQIGSDTTTAPAQPFRYFFQRQNPDSPTWDYNNIKRNQDLLGTYLTSLTSKNVPGFGGSFTGKYGAAGRDSLLVNAFDAIRSLNMVTTGTNALGTNSTLYDFAGMYFYNGASGTVSVRDQPLWQITPMNINLSSGATKSIGQFPTLPEVALIFYATKRNDPYPVPNPDGVSAPVFNATKLITATNPQTTEMRMVVYLSEFTAGNPYIGSSYWVKATGNAFTVNGAPIGFPKGTGNLVQMKETQWTQGVDFINRFYQSAANHQYGPFTPKSFVVGGTSETAYKRWEFVSDPIPMTPADGTTTFAFGGSEVTFAIYAPNPEDQDDSSSVGPVTLVQTIKIDFSKLNQAAAIPIAPRWIDGQIIPDGAKTNAVNPVPATVQVVPASVPPKWYAKGPHSEVAQKGYYLYQDEGFDPTDAGAGLLPPLTKKNISTSWPLRMICATADTQTNLINNSYYNITSQDIPELMTPLLSTAQPPPAYKLYPSYYPANRQNNNADAAYTGTPSRLFYGTTAIITPYDTVLSMRLDPQGLAKGDARVLAALATVPSSYYAPVCMNIPSRDYANCPAAAYPRTTAGWQRHSLGMTSTTDQFTLANHLGSGQDDANASDKISLLTNPMATTGWGLTGSGGNHAVRGYLGQIGEVNVAAFGRTAGMNATDPLGDWSNANGNFPDGCTLCYPDQWYATLGAQGNNTTTPNTEALVPFFGKYADISQSASFFSPNRQVSSGVALFGTLPSPNSSGVPQPWQTLLFCPNPAIGAGHPGFGTIGSTVADHLLLDLFWMPVVEPYAISEPLSTAGKINLNYQIIPFTNITRKTGLYAVMKSTKITAIPSTPAGMLGDYKSSYTMRMNHAGVSTRLNIDTAKTLDAFDAKFATNDIFRSASQICEMFLVPVGQTLANVQQGGGFWSGQQLTGSNSREAPYGHIYPRVTTKSNTFQIHYKVQVLKKRTGSDQTLWEEGKDKVVSEYRGSTILERFIDPNDSRLPDFATKLLTDTNAVIDTYYRFRVVSEKAFNP